METIQDVIEAGQGVVTIDHNLEADSPLGEVRHLLYNPHARPLLNDKRDITSPILPDSMPRLQSFFGTELGRDVLAYSYLRADTGSTEIGKGILEELKRRGQGALMLSSSVIGRGVLDLNRPRVRALDFHVPGAVGEELFGVHDIIMKLLENVFEKLKPGLKSVFQPHTMGSGNLNDEESDRFEHLTKQIKESAQQDDYRDQDLVQAALGELTELYGRMNNRRERPNVDVLRNVVVMGEKGPLRNADGTFQTTGFADHGVTSEQLAAALGEENTPWAYDDPFPHVPGYPGSELALKAVKANIVQGTLDVPRYLLQEDPNAVVDTLTFRPSPEKIQALVRAVVGAIST